MTTSEQINNLTKALAGFQGDLPSMPKNCSGYGYHYTDIDTISATIKPILKKYGLGYIQPIETRDNDLYLITRIFDSTGEFIETTVKLSAVEVKGTNLVQQMGAGITYMRRYALCSLLGITSDEDADGVIKETPKAEKKAPLKGGDATPEEKAELNKLFAAKYPDGKAIFTTEEKKHYSEMRKEKTAAEVIKLIDAETQKRVGAYIEQKENQ